jgi:hypothetical protein
MKLVSDAIMDPLPNKPASISFLFFVYKSTAEVLMSTYLGTHFSREINPI